MIIASANLKDIKAVAFDVFGTLVHITEQRHPFRQLMEKLCRAGRPPQSDDATRIMSANVGLAGAAVLLGVDLPASEIAPLEIDLYEELTTVELFPDTLPTLQALRAEGFKLALCSNLAAPYAVPVKLLLPPFDAFVWSFETGSVKPDLAIFRLLCERLDSAPQEVLMIGDTLEADHSGPRKLGMHGFHLARTDASPVSESFRTLNDVLALLGKA